MRMFLIAAFVLASVSTAQAVPRDAGSKIRNEANDSFGEAVRPTRRYYNYSRPAAVAAQPAAAPATVAKPAAPAVVAKPAAPAPNTTAAVDNTRTGTRTFSVEPQAAPVQTYRTYAPLRAVRGDNWSAGRKILGYREF